MAATEKPPPEKPARGTVTNDPELRALIVIQRHLSKLPDDARGRVLAYLRDKYGVPDPAVIATPCPTARASSSTEAP